MDPAVLWWSEIPQEAKAPESKNTFFSVLRASAVRAAGYKFHLPCTRWQVNIDK